MATDGTELSEAEMALVQRALDVAEVSDRLLHAPTAATAVAFADLYAYATRPDYQPSDALLTALESDTPTRRDFEALLKNTASYWIPQAAAASSGSVATREIDGCRMTFRTSKANENQVYVIIEFTDREAKPGALFVASPGAATMKLALPNARDGRVQLLLEADSEMAQRLQDVDTEVFLR